VIAKPYIKGSLVGIVTLFIATVAYILAYELVVLTTYPIPPGVHVSFAIVPMINRPLYWLIAIAAFALGFYWEFRRA
jgi:hypothetical protein